MIIIASNRNEDQFIIFDTESSLNPFCRNIIDIVIMREHAHVTDILAEPVLADAVIVTVCKKQKASGR